MKIKIYNNKYLIILLVVITISLLYYSIILLNNISDKKNSVIIKSNNLEEKIKSEKNINIKDVYLNIEPKQNIKIEEINKQGNKNFNSENNIYIKNNSPSFYRKGDKIEIKSIIFNNTSKEINLKIKFESSDILVNKSEKSITLGGQENKIVSFWTSGEINKSKNLEYKILALGNNLQNSYIIKKIIENKKTPNIDSIYKKGGIAKLNKKLNFKIDIPKNTDFKKSKVKISFSNNLGEKTKFAFSVGTIQNRDKRFYLSEENKNIITREFILDDIIQYKENHIELTTYVISGKNIITNLTLNIIAKDKFKIEQLSNGIKISREIFEILNKNELKKVLNNVLKKGSKYKILIKITSDLEKNTVKFEKNLTSNKNLILEDYIPSTFKVLQIKKSSVKNWDSIKYLDDKIISNTNKYSNNEINFEYIITPEFSGEFIYPPVNAYIENNLNIKAHSKFEKIIVKGKK